VDSQRRRAPNNGLHSDMGKAREDSGEFRGDSEDTILNSS